MYPLVPQIIHHTDCGMLLFTDDDLIAKVKEDTGADVSGMFLFWIDGGINVALHNPYKTSHTHTHTPQASTFTHSVTSSRVSGTTSML